MKRSHQDDDYDLQTLLTLDGLTYFVRGHWVKFSARKVEPSKNIPHGIKYCLTLHDKDNVRIAGYDNAHDCLPKRRNYMAKK
jgi:hypothetical protein